MVIIADVHGETIGIQVNSLSTRIRVVRSIDNGRPIGSLAIQTVVGAQDSRLVIKVGEVRLGGLQITEFEKRFLPLLQMIFSDYGFAGLFWKHLFSMTVKEMLIRRQRNNGMLIICHFFYL